MNTTTITIAKKIRFEEETESNAVKWKLRICYTGVEFQKFLRYFCKTYNFNLNLKRLRIFIPAQPISSLFMFLSIFVLVYVKELRTTVHGKILLCLLPNMLIAFSLFSSSFDEWIDMTSYSQETIAISAFYSSLLWLNVLTFDNWWSIR